MVTPKIQTRHTNGARILLYLINDGTKITNSVPDIPSVPAVTPQANSSLHLFNMSHWVDAAANSTRLETKHSMISGWSECKGPSCSIQFLNVGTASAANRVEIASAPHVAKYPFPPC